jgi:excinuclease UvrABC nuclease subunit
MIRKNGGWKNWTMIEVETYPCANEDEAVAREKYWINKLKPELNTYYKKQTKKEKTK